MRNLRFAIALLSMMLAPTVLLKVLIAVTIVLTAFTTQETI